QLPGHRPRGWRRRRCMTETLRSLCLFPRGRAWPPLAAMLLAAALAGCSSGTPRPTPAPLPPNIAQIGVRQAWAVKVPGVTFPLQVNVQGSQVMLAGDDGTVVTLDAATGRELSRAAVGEPLAAGVGSDG